MVDSKSDTAPKPPSKRFRELIESNAEAEYHIIEYNIKTRRFKRKYPEFAIDLYCVDVVSRNNLQGDVHRALVESMHRNNGSFEFDTVELEYWYEHGLDKMIRQAKRMLSSNV